MSDDSEAPNFTPANAAAGCLLLACGFLALIALCVPTAFISLKYVVVCWRLIGPLE
jgi:hypothetical protein